MTKFSPIMLLLLLQRQQQPSPRPWPPGLCFPKRASRACAPQASAPAVSPRAAWQPSASSGAPACPPSPRPTLSKAHRVTPAGQLSVSPLIANLLTPLIPFVRMWYHEYTVIITILFFLLLYCLSFMYSSHEYRLHKQPPPTFIMLQFAFSSCAPPRIILHFVFSYTSSRSITTVELQFCKAE